MENIDLQRMLRSMPSTVLLFFVSDVCGPSYEMKMLIDDLVFENRVPIKVVEIDIELSPGLVKEVKLRATPSLILFHEGEPIASRIGTQSETQFLEWIKSLVDKLDSRT